MGVCVGVCRLRIFLRSIMMPQKQLFASNLNSPEHGNKDSFFIS